MGTGQFVSTGAGMAPSYWERIFAAFRSLTPGQFSRLSKEMSITLSERIHKNGWFDTEDVHNHICTAFTGGSIEAIGLERMPVASNDISPVDEAVSVTLDDYDLMAVSRAVYLEMGGKIGPDGKLDEELISACLAKVLGGRLAA